MKIQKLFIVFLVLGCPILAHAQRGGNIDDEILQVLDANDDQIISFDEIEQNTQRIRGMDANGDKQVSVAELAAARGVGGGAALAKQLMRFDENEDGKLSPYEVPRRMRLIVRSADRDKDGLTDKTELATMAAEMAAAAPPAPRQRGGRDDDDDDDDEINPARMVKRALRFDADGNGQLDSQELTKFAEAFAQRDRDGQTRAGRPD